MSEHTPTPLPWTWTKNSWQYTTIYDGDDGAVCRFDLENWGVNEDNQDEQEEEQERVVAMIVKAVNAHEALVKALEDARDAMRSYLATFDRCGGSESVSAGEFAEGRQRMRDLVGGSKQP